MSSSSSSAEDEEFPIPDADIDNGKVRKNNQAVVWCNRRRNVFCCANHPSFISEVVLCVV
jgi:hypothetical protein